VPTSVTVCLLGQPSEIPQGISVLLDGEAMTPSPATLGCWIANTLDATESHMVSVTGPGIVPHTVGVTAIQGTNQMVTVPLTQRWPTTVVTVCLMGQPGDIPANIRVTLDGLPMQAQVPGCWALANVDPTQPHQVMVTGSGMEAQTSIVTAVEGTNTMVQLPLTLTMGGLIVPVVIGAGVVLGLLFILPMAAPRRNPRRRRNPNALRLGTEVEYGPERSRTRIDGRMMRTRSGKLTGYLGEDERHRLLMFRPNEIERARSRREPKPRGFWDWLFGR
jgi:hypothetical protein